MSVRLVRSIVPALVLALAAAPALAASFDVSGPTDTNVDDGSVHDVTFNVADTGFITDLDIRVNISGGGWITDLTLTLIHGSTQVVFYNPGVDNPGSMDAVFDDEAGTPYPTNGSAVGTFTPSPDLLSAFDGQQLSGAWTLRIVDNITPGDGEDLNSWSIFGQTTAVPEPGTVALFGLGALGLGAMVHRRRKAAAAAKTAPTA